MSSMDMHMSGMSATATGMSMSMTSGMSMPSSTGMSGMGGMNGGDMSGMGGMGHGMMMGMADMMMVFFTSASTPLYSSSWMPKSKGQYAGTCIFLIILAALFRGLLALRCNLPGIRSWWRQRQHGGLLESEDDETCCAKNGIREQPSRRWKINDALLLACVDTSLAGTSYLLMLAVMTMNVGYFMSVLGGTFVGSFILGHMIGAAAH